MSIDIRMTKARSQLVMDHAFFGSLIMRLRLIESRSVQTMATDGASIWYNPDFLNELTEEEILGTQVHEIFHPILHHHTRRGDRDHRKWNEACDYALNPMVIDAGFKLPEGFLYDPQFRGLSAEQIYRLREEAEEQAKPQQDEEESSGDDKSPDGDDESDDEAGGEDQDAGDDDGSGDQDGDGDQDAGGDGVGDQPGDAPGNGEGTGNGDPVPDSHGDPGGCGEILDAAPPHDKAALSEIEGEWEIAVRQAVNIAKKQGTLPGFMQEIVDQMNDPSVDWREVFNRFVDPSTTKDFSYANPSRRMLPFGFYVPGTISDGISHVAFVVDSSYSMDTATLRKVGSQAQYALDDGRLDKVTVVFCDTRVTKTTEYGQGEQINWEIPGRGGTAFSPAFEWLNANCPDIQCAIYFTDGEASDFGPEPSYPTLWALYGDPRAIKQHAARLPFGECVDVNQ